MGAFDWKASADLNAAFGMKEWIEAKISTPAKAYTFSSFDLKVANNVRERIPVNVDVTEHGVLIESQGNDGRHLEVVLSPLLLAEIIKATCHLAARTGSGFPHVEMARSLMAGGTSIVNRPRNDAIADK
jgi:hypothetical protein